MKFMLFDSVYSADFAVEVALDDDSAVVYTSEHEDELTAVIALMNDFVNNAEVMRIVDSGMFYFARYIENEDSEPLEDDEKYWNNIGKLIFDSDGFHLISFTFGSTAD